MWRRALVWTIAIAGASAVASAQEEVGLHDGREGLDPAVVAVIEQAVAAVHADPESVEAWSRLCMSFEANLLWPEAAECYQHLGRGDPDSAAWRHHEAMARLESGDVETARALLEAVVAQQPDLLPASERLGYLLLEEGELEASLARFEYLIERLPGRSAGYLGAGEVALLSGQVDRATEYLERAVELEPQAAVAHYQLGLAYREVGRLEEAERELALGAGGERRYLASPLAAEVASYSVHLTAQLDRAGALLQEGQNAEAAELLEKLVDQSPDNITLLNNLAIAYLREGRLEEAEALLNRALTLDDRAFSTYLNLSAWAGYKGDAGQAVEYARSAVELAPAVAATHLALARALGDQRFLATSSEVLAHRAEMLAEMEQAIEIGVDTPDVYLQLAREVWRNGRPDSAFLVLDQALERWPDFWPADLMRTWILVRSGRYPEAAEALEKVRAVMPEHPDIATLDRMIGEAGVDGER